MSAIPKKEVSFLDLIFFTGLKSKNHYPLDKLQSGICRSIQDRLGFYCVDLNESLTSVVFAYEKSPGVAEIWFLGGRLQDIPFLFKQFKLVRPDIKYLVGQRKHRAIKYSVEKLAKYFHV